MTPLFKKAGTQKVINNRALNSPSVIGKMLEAVIKYIIEKFKAIWQHDFVKGISYFTNLLEFFEEITYGVGKGERVHILFLDLSRYLLRGHIES